MVVAVTLLCIIVLLVDVTTVVVCSSSVSSTRFKSTVGVLFSIGVVHARVTCGFFFCLTASFNHHLFRGVFPTSSLQNSFRKKACMTNALNPLNHMREDIFEQHQTALHSRLCFTQTQQSIHYNPLQHHRCRFPIIPHEILLPNKSSHLRRNFGYKRETGGLRWGDKWLSN